MLGRIRQSLVATVHGEVASQPQANSDEISHERTSSSNLRSEGRNQFSKATLRSSFHDIAQQLESERGANEKSGIVTCVLESRRVIAKTMTLQQVDIFLGIVVLFDFLVGIKGVDARASGQTEPLWIVIGSNICFTVYVFELMCALFVKGINALTKFWTIVDAAIVFAGFIEIIVVASAPDRDSALIVIRFLRVFRIARLIKLFNRFKFLGELRRLVRMFLACMKTLFWSFLFCFVVMTCWSMAAVDFLQEHLAEAIEAGELDICPQCQTALLSVYHANIMFFKTAVAGDGWGAIAVPIMERHPWSSIIFVGAHATIVFGVLNLIVAVIVDEFAESRIRDVTSIAIEMDAKADEDRSSLVKMFKEIDKDGSGEVELEELLESAQRVPEFSARLRVMDVDERDLRQLFDMLDEDKSGSVSSDEFITALNRWMNDSKTAARFVKHNTEQSIMMQQEMHEDLVKKIDQIERKLRQVVWPQDEDDGKSTGSNQGKSDRGDEQEAAGMELFHDEEDMPRSAGAAKQSTPETGDGLQSVDVLCTQIAREAFRNLEEALRASIGNALSIRNEAVRAEFRDDFGAFLQADGYPLQDLGEQCPGVDPDTAWAIRL